MKKIFYTIRTVLLIIFFPLGLLYCIGTALFSDKRNFRTYIGIITLMGLSLLLGIYLVQPEWFDPIIAWCVDAWNWFAGIFNGTTV